MFLHSVERFDETDLFNDIVLERKDQFIIFRLRTGHNRLNHHLHRKMRLVPSPMCPCGEAEQTTEHILQDCRNFQHLREDHWPSPTPLQDKLYGPVDALQTTASFLFQARLKV